MHTLVQATVVGACTISQGLQDSIYRIRWKHATIWSTRWENQDRGIVNNIWGSRTNRQWLKDIEE